MTCDLPDSGETEACLPEERKMASESTTGSTWSLMKDEASDVMDDEKK